MNLSLVVVVPYDTIDDSTDLFRTDVILKITYEKNDVNKTEYNLCCVPCLMLNQPPKSISNNVYYNKYYKLPKVFVQSDIINGHYISTDNPKLKFYQMPSTTIYKATVCENKPKTSEFDDIDLDFANEPMTVSNPNQLSINLSPEPISY